MGNLTRLIRHSPGQGPSADEYTIGERDELRRVTFGRGSARDFEYDQLGRITRNHSEAGSTAFQYDDPGRLYEVSIDGTPATMSYAYWSPGHYTAWVGPECWTSCDGEYGQGRYDQYSITVLEPPCSVDFSLKSSDDFKTFATPAMPEIAASVTNRYPRNASVVWSAKASHTAPSGCTGGPTFAASVGDSGASFSPDISGYYGGDLTVSATCSASGYVSSSISKTAKITGTQPSDGAIVSELGTAGYPFHSADLRRISCQESYGMTQFVSSGLPLFGGGGDVGLMQICNRRTNADLWDWTANIGHGRQILAFATSRARSHLDREVDVNGATPYNRQMYREESIHRYNAGPGLTNEYREWVADPDSGEGRWVIVDRGGSGEAGLGSYVPKVLGQSSTCT